MTWASSFAIVGFCWAIAFIAWELAKHGFFGEKEDHQLRDLNFVLMEIKILLEEILRRE